MKEIKWYKAQPIPPKDLKATGDIGNWEVKPHPRVSNMVILRNYLPEDRELEEEVGRESGIRYEGTGNRESQGIKRWARGEGWHQRPWFMDRLGPAGPILTLRGKHITSILSPAGAKALVLWGNGWWGHWTLFLHAPLPLRKLRRERGWACVCNLACANGPRLFCAWLCEAISRSI